MAAKLKSISSQIPWFLSAKALAFAALWFFAPYWLFLIVGFLLYLFPLFRPLQFLFPFLLVLVLSKIFLEPSALEVFFLGLSFFLLIGTRDLLFINRRSVYHSFVLLMIFVFSLEYAKVFPNFESSERVWYALLLAIAFFYLSRGLARTVYLAETGVTGPVHETGLVLGLFSYLFFEVIWAVGFLPMIPLFQAAFLFLVAVVLIEFATGYLRGTLSRSVVLTNASLFLVFSSILLTLNEWRL